MSAPRRRSRLFTTSAFGALAFAALWAAPAHAQLVQTGATGNGGAPVIDQPNANTTNVTLNGSRTVIDWSRFDINSGDTANFVFANRNDIVLNRVNSATSSTINGNLNGTIGAGGAAGGNIWIYNANGVVIGANARISTGGLLVTTAAVDRATDSSPGGFLDDTATSFGFTGAASGTGITVQNGAQITSHGGAIALVAPVITTEAGSSISAQDGGNVLYGAAAKYQISFRQTGADDLDLLSFEVASGADGTGDADALTLGGATSGNRVFAALVSKTGVMSRLLLTGNLTATTAALDETGAIVLTTGHNIVNGAADAAAVAGNGGADIASGNFMDFTAPAISMLSSGSITVGTNMNAAGGTVDLAAEGVLWSNIGAITTGTLTARSGGSMQFGGSNQIAKINGITAGGDITFYNGLGSTEIAGDIVSSGRANLNIGQASGSGLIRAGSAMLSGGGAYNLDSAATLEYVYAITNDLTVNSTGDLTLNLSGSANDLGYKVILNAANGAIRQTGGAGLVGSVVANALGEIDLGKANSFTSLIANSTDGERITVNATGNLDFKVNTFSGAHFTVGGDATSSGTNALISGGLFVTAGGAINLSSDGGYTEFGDLSAGGNITLAMDGNLVLGGVIHAGGAMSLTSRGGAIRQTSGTISLGTSFTLNAVTGIDLNQTGNHLGDQSLVSDVTSGNGSNVRIRGDAMKLYLHGALGNVSLYGESGDVVVGPGLTASSLTAEAAHDIQIGSNGNTVAVGTYHRLIGTNVSVYNNGDFTVDGDVGRADVGRVELVAPNGTLTQAAGTIFGADISLRATYAINQDSGASIQGSNGNFGAIAGTDLLLIGANQLGAFPYFSWGTNADVTIRSVGNLYFDTSNLGMWLVPFHTLKLISDEGSVGVYGGFIADTLNVQAHGDILLDDATYIVNKVGSVTGLTSATGNISLREDNGFDINGDISAAAGNITLRSDGAIETYSGALSLGGTLAVTAGGGASLTGAGAIKLGAVSTSGGGNFYLSSDGNIDLTGAINTGTSTLILSTTNGAITSNGGTISAWATNAYATGAITLVGSGFANFWATSTGGGDIHLSSDNDLGFAATTTGALTVETSGQAYNTGDLGAHSVSITAGTGIGLINTGFTVDVGSFSHLSTDDGLVSVDLQGDIKLAGNVTAGGTGNTVSLTSGGSILQNSGTITGDIIKLNGASAITQASGATLHGGALSLTSSGNVALGQANDFTSIAALSIGGDLTLRNLGSIDLDPTTGGGATLGGALTVTSDTGDISAGNVLTTSKLTATALNGSILIGGGSHLIGSLGTLTAAGDIQIGTDVPGFTLTGDITATTVTLLAMNGGITQNAGTKITAGTLYVAANNNITLDQANAVTTVGSLIANLFTSGHNITFRNDGNIILDSRIDATGGTLTLTSNTGGITQNNGAGIYVRANQLILNAAGYTALGSTNNNVTTIGGITNLGWSTLYQDADGFDVAGNLTAGAGSIILRAGNNGAITQSAGIISADAFGAQAGTVTFTRANQFAKLLQTQGSTSVTINTVGDLAIIQGLSGDTISLTSGGAITQQSGTSYVNAYNTLNLSAVTGIDLSGGAFGANNIINLGTLTNTTSGGIRIATNNGGYGATLAGNISAIGQTVTISDELGALNQTGGVITADTLNLSATAGVNATRANAVTNLGTLSAGGASAFTNAGSFNISQSINAAGNSLALTSTSGAITQNAGTTLTADTMALNAGTTISQGAGASLHSTDLSLTSGGTTTLGGANDFTRITGLNVGGDLTLRNLGLIDLSPGFASYSYRGGGALTLISDTSSILSTNTGISTSLLTASAVGSVNLSGTIASVGNVSANSVFLWTYYGNMTLTGNITASNVSLGAEQGSVNQTGGIIDAGRLNVTTDGTISLTGANQVDVFGGLNTNKDSLGAYHDITIRNVGGIVLDYLVQAGGATVDLTSDTGGISQTSTNGGFITAGTLKANAAGDIVLDQGNDFDHLGAIRSTGGNVTIVDSDAFDLTGQVRAAGALSLTSGGAITTNGGLVVAGGLLNVSGTSANLIAGGNVQLGAVTTNGNFAIDTDGNLTVAGLLNTNGGDATLKANFGTIGRGASGSISANSVAATARDSITLDSTGNAIIWASSSNGGDINLTGNANIFFKIDTTGDLTVDAGGAAGNNDSVIARSVGINAAGGIYLNDQTVAINVGSYRYLTSSAGAIDIENKGDIKLDGNVTANAPGQYIRLYSSQNSILQNSGTISGDNVQLQAVGNITQSSGAKVVANTLALTGIDVSLGGANEIGALDAYSISRDFTLRTVGTLDLGGAGNQVANNGNLTLTSDTGNITGVYVETNKLTATATNGSIVFTYGNNKIRGLGDLTAKSTSGTDINIYTATALGLSGNISGGGVQIYAGGGAITQGAGGITADRLAIGAGTSLLIGGANNFGTLTDMGHGVGADVTIRNQGNLLLPSNGTAIGTLNLTSDTGTISQTSALTANTLIAHAATGIGFNSSSNNFTTLAGLTTDVGDIRIRDTGGLAIEGDITAPGTVFLSTTGNITTGTTTVGVVTTPHGKVDADKLSVVAINATIYAAGDIKLDGIGVNSGFTLVADNNIDLTGTFTAIATSLIATAGAITQSGGTVNVTTGAMAAASNITLGGDNRFTNFIGTSTGGGTITLNNGGSGGIVVGLNTTGNAVVTAGGNLASSGINVDGLSMTAGHIDLTNSVDVNSFSKLVATYGDVLVSNAGSFAVAGDVSASKVGLRSVNLLANGGGISQTAGTISANDVTLRGSGDIVQSGTGRIDANASILTGANLDLMGSNSFGAATPTVVRAGGTVRLNGDALYLQFMNPAGDVTLSAAGDITVNNFGLQASSLTVNAGGQLSATSSSNQVATVHGLSGTSIDFASTGFTLDGNVTATNGATLTATSGGIAQTAGTISAASATLSAAGGSVVQSGNAKIVAPSLSVTAGGDLILGGANDFTGASSSFAYGDGSNVTLRNLGSIDFAGIPGYAINALSLTSDTGAISQGGPIAANSLFAKAATGIAFGHAGNAIGTIAGLTNSTSGGILFSTFTNLDLAGNISAAGQEVLLVSIGHAMTQSSGGIVAGTLRATASTGLSLTSATNNVANIAGLTNAASGGIAYTDADSFDITGDINALNGQSLSLTTIAANANVRQNGGLITSGAINLSGGQSFSLRGSGGIWNSIAGVGNVNTAAQIYTSGNVALTGTISSPYFELWSQGGNITQSAGQILYAPGNFLDLRASGISLTSATNQLGSVDALIAYNGGGITVVSDGNTRFGAVEGGTASLTVTNGSIGNLGDYVNVDTLNAAASGTINLGGRIGTLGNVTAGGDASFRSSSSLSVNGTINLGTGRLSLGTGGTLSQLGGAITAGGLDVTAAGAITMNANNDVGTIYGLATQNGGISYSSNSGFALGGDITAGGGNAVSLNATLGSINQNAGIITAARLDASAGNQIVLTRANQVGQLGSLTAANAASFTVRDDLTLVGSILSNAVTLISIDGAISQTSGAITAASLSAYASTGLDLFHANNVTALGGLGTTSGDLRFRNSSDIALTNMTVGGNLTLVSDSGAIRQNVGTILTVGDTATLTADGGIRLDSNANAVTRFGAVRNLGSSGDITLANAGDLILTDNVGAFGQQLALYSNSGAILQQGGTLTGDNLIAHADGAITLGAANNTNPFGSIELVSTTGDIRFRSVDSIRLGTVSTPGLLSLTSDTGGINQIAAISAGALTVTSLGGDILLGQANAIGTVNDVTTNGRFTLNASGNLTLDGEISAPGLVRLIAAGNLTQTGTGVIRSSELQATSGTGATNGISLLNRNDVALATLNSNGKDLRFRNTGDFALGNISAAGHIVEMISDGGAVTQQAGTSIVAGIFSATGTNVVLDNSGNQISRIGLISTGSNLNLRNGTALQIDAIDAGSHNVTINNGDNLTGGNITAGTLTLNLAGGYVDLTTANHVASLGGFSGGQLSFTNAGSFTISGAIQNGMYQSILTSQSGSISMAGGAVNSGGITAQAATGISLTGNMSYVYGATATTGDVSILSTLLDIQGDISGDTVTLGGTANGGYVRQTSGSITANKLIATGYAFVDLNGATNHIASLGALSSPNGYVKIASLDAVTLTADVDADDTFTLNAGGAVRQTGGRINTGWLRVSAAGDIDLGAANQIDAGSDVILAGDDVTFVNTGTFTIAGITAANGGAIDVRSINGNIWQSGAMTGGSITASAHGSLSLDKANAIGTVGALSAGTELTYNGAAAYDLTGAITAGTSVTLNGAAGINQTGGTITGQTLSVDADSADLQQANAVGRLGTVTTSGDFLFRNVGDVALWGTVHAGSTLGLYSDTGSVTNPGGLFTANILDVTAAGSVELLGGSFNYIDSLTSQNGDITLTTSSNIFNAGRIAAGNGTVDLTVGRITANSVKANLLNIDATGGDIELTGDNVIAHLGNLSGVNISLAVGTTDITGWLNGTGSVAFVRSALATDFALTMASGGVITTPMISLSNTGTAGTATLNNISGAGPLELNFNFNGNATVSATGSAVTLNNATVDGNLFVRGTSVTDSGAGADISGTLGATALAGNISLLFGTDRVGQFGNLSAGSGTVSISAANVSLTGNVIAAGAFSVAATNGSVTQSAGSLISAASITGSATGDMLLGGSNTIGRINALSAGGDLTFKTSGALDIAGALTAGTSSTMTLIAGGDINVAGADPITGGTLNISTPGHWANFYNTPMSPRTIRFSALGDVSASNFQLYNDGAIDLAGDIVVTMGAVIDATGQITQSAGALTVDLLALYGYGVAANRQNQVQRLQGAANSGTAFSFTNAQDLRLIGNLGSGDVTLNIDGNLTATAGIYTSGDILITAKGGYVRGLWGNNVTFNGGANDLSIGAITTSDDVSVTGTGNVTVGSLYLNNNNDAAGDGFNALISGGNVTLGGATGAIGSANVIDYGVGATPGSVKIQATGNATLGVDAMYNAAVAISAAGDVDARSLGRLLLGTVAGANVTLVADADVQASSIATPGTYSVTGSDIGLGALTFASGNPLDVVPLDAFITDTQGNLALPATFGARRSLTISAVGDITGGQVDVGTGTLSITGTGIALGRASSSFGDVELNAGIGTVDIGTVYVAGDYRLSGGSLLNGALAPGGARAGTWTLTSLGAVDMGGRTLEYGGDISFLVSGLLGNGTIRSLSGSVTGSAIAIQASELLGATGVDVSTTAGNFEAFHIDGGTGDARVASAGTLNLTGSIEAGGDVHLSTTGSGGITAGYASAGGNITLYARGGDAILRQAKLTGTAGDLMVQSTTGDAILGANDYSGIGNDIYFERASGSAGTAKVLGDTGAYANLHHSAMLTQVTGAEAEVNVRNGNLTIGELNATTGNASAYLNAGALTVTRVSGDTVDLEARGGNLTLGGGTVSANDLYLTSDSLVDTSAVSNLTADRYLRINGGEVRAASLGSGGDLVVNSSVGGITIDELNAAQDASVLSAGDLAINQVALAGGGQFAANGSATVRSLTAVDGFALVAQGNVTLGADTAAAIDVANSVVTGGTLGGCGCGTGGGTVVSLGGDVTINLLGLTGVFDTIQSDGNSSVTIRSGNLGINFLQGHDVTLDAGTGTIELNLAPVVAHDYTLTAGHFAGNSFASLGTLGGSLSITDTAGDFDFGSTDFAAAGSVSIRAAQGQLHVRNAQAGNAISLAAGGDLTLAGAALTGTGANAFSLSAGGNLTFGAADAASITSGNAFSNAGTLLAGKSLDADGDLAINLYRADALGAVDGGTVQARVLTGNLAMGDINAVGAIAIAGPSGTLTLGDVTTSAGHINIAGQGDVTTGDISGRFVVNVGASTGSLRFGNLAGGDVALAVAGGITGAGVSASTLGVVAVNGGVDLDQGGSGSHVASLGMVTVNNGGFKLRNLQDLGLDGVVEVHGTLDLQVAGALTQNNYYIIADRLQGGATGAALLTGGNSIAELGQFASNGLKLTSNIGLTIDGTVQGNGGAVTIASHGGMTISANGRILSSAAGDAITLASDGLFTNARGADALAAANGRWLIYTQTGGNFGHSDPNNNFGGLAGTSYYGDFYDFNAGTFATAPNAGNRFVYGYRPLLTVTPDSFHVTYNGAVPVLTATITGLVNGDSAGGAWSGAAALSGAGRNAGTYAVYAALGTLASEMNYAFAFGAGTVVVDPRVISAILTADNRVYDGTTNATGSLTLTGLVSGDQVAASGVLAFDSKNAGTRTATASGITLSGTDAANYVISSTSTTALADIIARTITATLTANGRTYDGTTSATGTLALNGLIGNDQVAANGTLAFDSKNAGTRTVTASGITLSGADAGNYVVSGSATALADILAKAITATLTANGRTYDGTTNATGSLALNGVVGGDQVSVNGSYAFDNKNAGTGHTVTASGITLSGADAGNYTVGSTATALADIIARTITATLTANDRTYDGTTSATGTLGLNGVIAGDAVSVNSTGMAFDSKNAGTRTVTASGISLSGTDAGNYVVAATATDLADILAKAITATLTANGRVYDGTTAATGTLGLSGVVLGDQVGVTASGIAFDSKNAGNRTATASGLALNGADAANYTISGTATGTATIAQRAITATATADSRAYDGTTGTTGRIALAGVISGDTVTGTATYRFADANAGTGRAVQVSGLALTGADAGNYAVSLSGAPVIADITRRAVSVTAQDATKLFGQPDPVFGYTVSAGSLVNGDGFTGALARIAGEQVGSYAIGQGTLALSANYLLTVIPGTLVISFTQSGADASDALRMLRLGVGGGFSLNQNPSRNLEGDGEREGAGDGDK
ncbi:YDG domain-containing protein [Sphingomonas sp. CBMAI 2297]|uniref:YDG domain-containing protein n=1 Tax=Sphingomonas sp. CBMAI 2297 TaxID=2991720 RepID=UPI002458AD45|nr:YDG domain-containing protein [Sphingomonas sp. CBMAI 2297]MDH4746427.1 YDG domain-containing protein [Sphingomonas sp. CBMAI 2297]